MYECAGLRSAAAACKSNLLISFFRNHILQNTSVILYFQKAMKVGGVDRLTDTKLYTGAHKERFDESGKGKGIEGRENVTDNSGYVGAYKGSGTYDKK